MRKETMADLTTTYLGLKLKNPLVASASPLSEKLDSARQLEDAGASALVMYSLFEEQIIQESLELDYYLERGTHAFAEAMTYFPEAPRYKLGAEAYLEQVKELKSALSIPVIGSLNGTSEGDWIDLAEQIEAAGADALELNLYYLPTESQVTATDLEDRYVSLVKRTAGKLSIPVSVKLSPFFTSLPNVVQRLAEAGAKGVVLFNRFYQPDLNLETLEVEPNLTLSSPDEMRLPLRWIAVLYGRVAIDLALSSGAHAGEDVVKATMAGASVTMMTSALLKNGPNYATNVLAELERWMVEHEYESIQQMQGSMSQKAVAEPAAFERANYIKVLSSYNPYNLAFKER
jgi:dihydroorotate dehydrogenase (fumarate)